MKFAYKIAVVIAILVLLYTNYYNNMVVVTSQPKGGTVTGDKSDDETHSRSTGESMKTSQAVSCTSTTTRVIQTPEAPGPGPIDFNSFLVTQKRLNKTHCLIYFVVENRTTPHEFASSKLWNVYNVLNDFPSI